MIQLATDRAATARERRLSQAVLLYDGQCGFCHSTVQWLLKHDKFDRFRFAPQQSAFAEAVLRRHDIDREALFASNTAYLVLDLDSPAEKLLTRSDVTAQALLRIGGGWRILGWLLQTVPLFARNAAYTVLAKNRFRISERFENCLAPSAAERMKFLG